MKKIYDFKRMALDGYIEKGSLYIGLQEGGYVATRYWQGGVDSALEKIIENCNFLTIFNNEKEGRSQEFIILDDNNIVPLIEENENFLYDYYLDRDNLKYSLYNDNWENIEEIEEEE